MAKSKFKFIAKLAALCGLFFASAASISACGGGGGGDNKHQYINDIRLKLAYKERNFFDDGIGQVNVETYIDGDTTHFKNVYGNKEKLLKSRYYGIDTPESTGNIQEYGKQASNFTHEKLANAAENGTIVVCSPFSIGADGGAGKYDEPVADSTGSRYLSLVWINETKKNCDPEELYLLNLYIVQEGLSWAKNVNDVPAFEETFLDAQNQAERLKLKLWSGEPDPDYNYGDYNDVSLLDIKEEVVSSLKDPTHENTFNNANVRFTGVVSGYGNNTLYVQEHFFFDDQGNPYDPLDIDLDDYTPEQIAKFTDEWAGINIFTGTSPIPVAYSKVGTYLRIVGTSIDSETFGFQVSDTQGKFPNVLTDDPYMCNVIIPAEQNTGDKAIEIFEYSVAELNEKIGKNVPNTSKDYSALFCRTKVKEQLVCSGAYLNDDGDELTLYFDGCDFNVYVPFAYHGVEGDNWMDVNKVIGKTFEVTGVLGYHKTKSGKYNFQIIACNDSDLVCVTPTDGTIFSDPFTVSEAYEKVGQATKNIRYYVTGKTTGDFSYTFTHDDVSTKDTYYGSFTLTDGVKNVSIVNAVFPEGELKKINDAKTDEAKQAVIKAYADKFLAGSTVIALGVPSMEGENLKYSDGGIHDVKLHGELPEDPLSTAEALEIATNATTRTVLYYITGVVSEITTPWGTIDGRAGRISFVLRDINDETVTFNVYAAKYSEDVTETLVGKTILLQARLEKAGGVPTTSYNGCLIVSISETNA